MFYFLKSSCRVVVGLVIVGFTLSQSGLANVVGSDFQNFNPTTNGVDFVTVQSGQTLRPGIFNLGLFANYAVNALPEFKDGTPYNYPRGTTRNTGTFSDFNMGLGLTSFLDVGLSFPAIVTQSVKDETTSRLEYTATGVNEFRLNSKLKMLGNAKQAVALVGTVNINRIDNNPYEGNPSRPIYTLELAGHTSLGNTAISLNAGYRKKDPGQKLDGAVVEPFHDQLIGSTAMSYLFKSIDTKLIAEFFGSQAASNKTSSEVLQKSGEVLVGVKHDVTSQLALHAGATFGVIDSPATPDWRLYAGINWNAGPLWRNTPPKRIAAAAPKKPAPPRPAPKTQEAPMSPEPVPVQEPRETFILEHILFANDSSTQVLSGALDELKELVDHLKEIPAWSRLVVEGHTDSVGDDQYNLDLSMRRANAVRAYLVKHLGVDAGKLTAVGYGESRPIADNSNYQGRQQNRRVEIKIFD